MTPLGIEPLCQCPVVPDIGIMVRVAQETWVQFQVKSYQRLKKWYFMPPCLTLSIIRYGSRVKWSNPGKGVAPSPTPWCSSNQKGRLGGCQLYLLYLFCLTNFLHIRKNQSVMNICFKVETLSKRYKELLKFRLQLWGILKWLNSLH